jgi:excisionase family DNA binding protein
VEEDTYTTGQAAKILKVSDSYIRGLVRSGELEALQDDNGRYLLPQRMDHAIWRRIKLVPFEVRIPEHEKDKKLPEKLRAERSGILLAWAVRGCLDWHKNGLGEPEEVRAATEAYRAKIAL